MQAPYEISRLLRHPEPVLLDALLTHGLVEQLFQRVEFPLLFEGHKPLLDFLH